MKELLGLSAYLSSQDWLVIFERIREVIYLKKEIIFGWRKCGALD